ncbi:DUF58 domain-containing protein [Sphaerisporangium sp. B11E5]|uniref:DUF58 domain-containing protein n=1 Tax=Sphaerisporangium sp. B11E5 TaxID=3153563 RepID=UPI00325DD9C9
MSRGPRLTGTGVAAAAGGGVLAAAGSAAGYPALAGVGACALTLVLVAVLLLAFPARLEGRRTVTPGRVTVDTGATGRLLVRNTGRLATGPATASDGGEHSRVLLPPLAPGAEAGIEYGIPTPRRGLVRVGPLTLDRRDPFGLARRTDHLAPATHLWVRPRVHPLAAPPAGMSPGTTERVRHDRAVENASAYDGLREYRAGDDPRRIHWPSTARTGQLVVRKPVDGTGPGAVVVLDTRTAALPPDAFEDAVEIAASVMNAAGHGRRAVTLHVLGEDTAAAALAGARTPVDRLALVTQADGHGLASLRSLVRGAGTGGALILVTGTDPAVPPLLASERRSFGRAVLVRLSPDETSTTVRDGAGLTVIRAASARKAVSALGRLGGDTR